MSKRVTITFEPDEDVNTMLARAVRAVVQGGRQEWGAQTQTINDVLREGLARRGFARKRELQAA